MSSTGASMANGIFVVAANMSGPGEVNVSSRDFKKSYIFWQGFHINRLPRQSS